MYLILTTQKPYITFLQSYMFLEARQCEDVLTCGILLLLFLDLKENKGNLLLKNVLRALLNKNILFLNVGWVTKITTKSSFIIFIIIPLIYFIRKVYDDFYHL